MREQIIFDSDFFLFIFALHFVCVNIDYDGTSTIQHEINSLHFPFIIVQQPFYCDVAMAVFIRSMYRRLHIVCGFMKSNYHIDYVTHIRDNRLIHAMTENTL